MKTYIFSCALLGMIHFCCANANRVASSETAKVQSLDWIKTIENIAGIGVQTSVCSFLL